MVVIKKKKSPLDHTFEGEEQDTVSEQNIWLNQTGFKRTTDGMNQLRELSKSAANVNPFKSKLDQSYDNYSRGVTNLD